MTKEINYELLKTITNYGKEFTNYGQENTINILYFK